jgi:uncharacterized membrane protein
LNELKLQVSFSVWLLHCHIDFHAEVGMAMMLKVGDYSQMAPVPQSFPTCYDYNANPAESTKKSASATVAVSISVFVLAILANFLPLHL